MHFEDGIIPRTIRIPDAQLIDRASLHREHLRSAEISPHTPVYPLTSWSNLLPKIGRKRSGNVLRRDLAEIVGSDTEVEPKRRN